MDTVLREAATSGVLCDVPDALVVRHDLLGESGQLRRAVFGRTGLLENVLLPLEGACSSCALREDIVTTVSRIAATRVPGVIVLAPPVTTDPLPVVRALTASSTGGIAVAGVLSVFDGARLEWDILGDDLLDERGLALTSHDRRSVGEALVHQIEYADVLLTPTALRDGAAALLDHLIGDATPRMLLHSAAGRELFTQRGGMARQARVNLRAVAATGAPAREGLWTLDLQSWRPLHPGRLLRGIERLGAGPVRGRGHFWLPTRQDVVCGWDGAGGQLRIGDIGAWTAPPRTRLVITGTDRDPADLLTAFDIALMTDAELGQGLAPWEGRDDGFDAWLGARQDAA